MKVREIAHILTIAPNPEDDENWDWEITCQYEPDGYHRPGCSCSMYMECDCKPSEEEVEQVHCDGEGPCSTAPDGLHFPIPGSHYFAYPVNRCYAKECDFACDVVYNVHADHGFGVYLIAVTGGWDELEFDVLARVEAVPS